MAHVVAGVTKSIDTSYALLQVDVAGLEFEGHFKCGYKVTNFGSTAPAGEAHAVLTRQSQYCFNPLVRLISDVIKNVNFLNILIILPQFSFFKVFMILLLLTNGNIWLKFEIVAKLQVIKQFFFVFRDVRLRVIACTSTYYHILDWKKFSFFKKENKHLRRKIIVFLTMSTSNAHEELIIIDNILVKIFHHHIMQACQTQTSLWAPKATTTAEGASKVLKNPSVGHT